MSSLVKSNLVVASGTAVSRLTGVARLFVFGAVIGQTALADAYKLANETPNIIYDLLLGGVLSATLVPLFSSLISDQGATPEQRAENQRATNVVLTVASTLMLALTLIALLAAPLIFRLYSLNVADDVDAGEFRSAGTTLTRFFVIQILFYGLTGLGNAYLQSRRRFLAAAWSPALANVIVILSLLSLPAKDVDFPLTAIENDRIRLTLGLGATLGIATMALAVVPAMFKAGLRFRPVWDWRHPVVRKLFVLSGWTLGFVAANQVAVVVIRNLAQGEGEGLLSAYVDAFLWFVLPHGLLAVSISTTFQPELARAVINRQRQHFVERMRQAVRVTALLTLPAASGLLVIGRPIVGLMQRNNFTGINADNTAEALAGLAIGLTGFSIFLLVMRGFYAHHDTRTPFVLNVGENLLNIVLAVLFVRWWGVFGLGLAYSIAYLVAGAWALQVMSYKVRQFSLGDIGRDLWRPLLAAVLMSEAMWLMTKDNNDDQGPEALTQVLVAGTIGVFVYVAVLFALRTPDLDPIVDRLARRGRRQHGSREPSEALEPNG